MTSEQICPIWGISAEVKSADYGFVFDVNSPRAGGAYQIDKTAKQYLSNADEALKARLTTWLVDQRKFGIDCPAINVDAIKAVRRTQPLSMPARVDRLLELFVNTTPIVGSQVICASSVEDGEKKSYPFLANSECINVGELRFLTEYLIGKHWVAGSDWHSVVVTVDGYSRLADLATKPVNSSQAFVAMWFDDSMNDAYSEGIEPGIRDAGYGPFRVDGKEHNNKIDDEIVAEIRRSRFLVADFTQDKAGARGGVYYEAGFAQGLNLPVIFTCRKDVIKHAHFDTRQYNHIVWVTPQELRTRLSQRICATIGDGPFRQPTE